MCVCARHTPVWVSVCVCGTHTPVRVCVWDPYVCVCPHTPVWVSVCVTHTPVRVCVCAAEHRSDWIEWRTMVG